jgi:hypothetical protein
MSIASILGWDIRDDILRREREMLDVSSTIILLEIAGGEGVYRTGKAPNEVGRMERRGLIIVDEVRTEELGVDGIIAYKLTETGREIIKPYRD